MNRKILLSLLLIFIVSAVLAQENLQAPGLNILGFGYDIFGNYADNVSKKRYRLFEYSEYKEEPIGGDRYLVPEFVILESMSRHLTKTAQGSSQRDYATSLAANAGLRAKTMFFSGSVNSAYNWSSSGSVQKYYFTYMDANTKWRISYDVRHLDQLKTILEPQAKIDINNMDPAELFELYGTHFISSAYLGGRAELTTETIISESTTMEEMSVAVSAKFKMVSGSASLSTSEQEAVKNTEMTAEMKVFGGNSEFVQNIQNPEDYRIWAEGLKASPSLCDFDETSLTPIWDLADKPGRRTELQNYFEVLCSQRPLPPAMANLIAIQQNLYMIRNAETGTFWDLPGYHLSARSDKNTPIQLFDSDLYYHDFEGADRFISITPHKVDNEWVFLQPQNSNFVASLENATDILKLSDYSLTSDSAQFKLIPVDGEFSTYFIEQKLSGLYLAASGSEITGEKFSGDKGQQWVLDMKPGTAIAPPPDGVYAIENSAGGLYLDYPGSYPTIRDEPMKLWNMGASVGDRIFKITTVEQNGSYIWKTIEPMHRSNQAITSNGRGSEYGLSGTNKANSQLFRFEYGGGANTWHIIEKSGYAMSADINNYNANGCAVTSSEAVNTINQQWTLHPIENPLPSLTSGTFYIRLAGTSKYLDVSGSGESTNENKKNIQIWSMDSGNDRKVKFVPAENGAYYIEFQNGGRVLDIQSGDKDNSANAILYTNNHKPWQMFMLIRKGPNAFEIQNLNSKKVLDVTEGDDGFTNGDNVKQWESLGTPDQLWEIVYASGSNKNEVWGW